MSRLARWSARKRAAAPEAHHDTPVELEPDAAVSQPEDTPGAEAPVTGKAQPLDPGTLDHTLPDPETLPPGSDFRAFLAPGVSAGLRKRALRRLFSADHYAVRDGLDDYDDDYRARLKPLAGELAERLRQWTRRVTDDDPATREQAASETAADDSHRITDEEKSDFRREVASHHSTLDLDEGRSGENAKSDQH